MTKPNEQHQFDLIHVPHNVLEANTCKYILTGVDLTSRYKVAKALETKKEAIYEVMLEAIYKTSRVFKNPEVFQHGSGPEFKSDVTELLEKHNVDIRSTITKCKHTHTAFLETISKGLAKQLLTSTDAQELQNPKNLLAI